MLNLMAKGSSLSNVLLVAFKVSVNTVATTGNAFLPKNTLMRTFSSGKSILLISCPLDVQYKNAECLPAKFFL